MLCSKCRPVCQGPNGKSRKRRKKHKRYNRLFRLLNSELVFFSLYPDPLVDSIRVVTFAQEMSAQIVVRKIGIEILPRARHCSPAKESCSGYQCQPLCRRDSSRAPMTGGANGCARRVTPARLSAGCNLYVDRTNSVANASCCCEFLART